MTENNTVIKESGTFGCGCLIIAIMIALNFDRILDILEKAVT